MASLRLNVLACGTYCTVAFVSDTLLDGIKATLTLPIIILVMATMSYICYTEYLSLSLSLSSGDPPSVITATMFIDISSSTVLEILGKQTFCGYHSCADEQVTCGHVCSSLSAGVLVANQSIVPLEENGSIKSWSSVAMEIGASEKGLSWNVILYAHSWLGFTRV